MSYCSFPAQPPMNKSQEQGALEQGGCSGAESVGIRSDRAGGAAWSGRKGLVGKEMEAWGLQWPRDLQAAPLHHPPQQSLKGAGWTLSTGGSRLTNNPSPLILTVAQIHTELPCLMGPAGWDKEHRVTDAGEDKSALFNCSTPSLNPTMTLETGSLYQLGSTEAQSRVHLN